MDSGYQFYGRIVESDERSGAAAGRHTRCPGPLEVVPTEVSGDIHYLTDKIQVWTFQHRHGLG